jgi:superfamily I DNA and/or RNA helicase
VAAAVKYQMLNRCPSRHEHLYEKIQGKVIESHQFPETILVADRILAGCRVILCTISMLSNEKISPFTRNVPVETVIVDEASQIEVGAYLPILSLFRSKLKKIVFMGDHKQCE